MSEPLWHVPLQWGGGRIGNYMLQEFTWQQFLVAAMVLSLLWYGGLWFFFLRKGKTALLDDRAVGAGSARVLTRDNLGEIGSPGTGENDLMGRSKLPEGMELLGSNELQFTAEDWREDQLGLVPDLLEELKKLFVRLVEGDGGKPEFFRLLEMLKEGFPKMGGHPQIDAVNGFIIDHAPFHLTAEDIDNLWY